MRDAGGLRPGFAAGGSVERRMTALGGRHWRLPDDFRELAEPRTSRGSRRRHRSCGSLARQGDDRVTAGFVKMPSFEALTAGDARLVKTAARLTSLADLRLAAPHPASTNRYSNHPRQRRPPDRPEYVTLGPKPNLPIVVNNLPDSFTPWSPEDEYPDVEVELLRVGCLPGLHHPNGHDLWLGRQRVRSRRLAQLGGPAERVRLALGQPPRSGSRSGVPSVERSFEADIALNPAFGFTLDDEWVYNGSTAQGFRLVMLHELGHMLGLDHEFNGMAVMNYFPSVFRSFAHARTWTMPQAIRALYPRNAVSRTDLGVDLYYASGSQSVTDATYPSSVVAGGTLTVNNFTIENVGTTLSPTPTIEWYLTAPAISFRVLLAGLDDLESSRCRHSRLTAPSYGCSAPSPSRRHGGGLSTTWPPSSATTRAPGSRVFRSATTSRSAATRISVSAPPPQHPSS